MKRFWTKFLVASVVCTSMVSPILATDIDAQADTTSVVETSISDSKIPDSGFHILVPGASNTGDELAMTFELQDSSGKSYGTATTDKSNIVNTYDNILTFDVPKYAEGDEFVLILKDAPENVKEVYVDDEPITVGGSVKIKVNEVKSEDTGEPILYGCREYFPLVNVISENVNDVLLSLKKGDNFISGITFTVKDPSNGVVETFNSIDTGVLFKKTPTTNKLELTLETDGYKFKTGDGKTFTVELKEGQANFINVEIEEAPLTTNNAKPEVKKPSTLTVSVSTNANTDLSTYWSNLDIELTNGDMSTVLEDIQVGKREFQLANMDYKFKVLGNDAIKVTSKDNGIVKLTEKGTKLDISIEPTHKLSISKSVDGSRKPYKFKVINVPEIADKVYSGTDPIEFAVMSGEAYMIEDVDSGEVLNVAINDNNPVTKVVLGEGVVTGFASVPETGDEGNALILGLVLSLAGIFIIGGTIIVKKKPKFKDVKKAFSLLLVASIVGSTFVPNTYAGSNMSGGDGSSGGTATSVPNGTGNLMAGVVRVYPAMLTDLGFSPAEGDYDANGTKQILAKDNKYWLHQYSIYFAPNTSVRTAWDRGSYIVASSYNQAVNQHKDINKGGNYHKVIKQGGEQLLYHDYYDDNHAQPYMTKTSKSNVTVDLSSHGYGDDNLFVNIMSKAMKDKNIRTEDYGTVLQKEFSQVLKSGDKDRLWNDYKEIASKHNVYNNNPVSPNYSFAVLDKAFEEGRLGFFVESTIGWKVQGQSNKNIFMSLRTYLQVLNASKPGMFDYSEIRYEKTTAQKSGVKGCSGGSACSRGATCAFFHHLGWSHANIKDAYTVTLRPSTKPLQVNGNPFGGWGYLHMNGALKRENKPGIYVIIKDATAVEPDGTTYKARGIKGSDTIELAEYEENRTFVNTLALLGDDAEIREGISLENSGVMVANEMGRAVRGQLQFTEETQIRVFLDSEYQEHNIIDLNTTTPGVHDDLGHDDYVGKDNPMTPLEKSATHTKTGSDATSIVLGGGNATGGTNWFGSDLQAYIRNNKPVYNDAKYLDGKPYKKAGDLSDILIVVTDVNVEIPETVADENDKLVPEWRLSKYWDKLVTTDKEVSAISTIGKPQDDGSSHETGTGLSPSGEVTFNKVAKKDDLPPFLFTEPVWGDKETGKGSITKATPEDNLKIQGDLLASKKNEEIDNIKVSKWVPNTPSLKDLGIGSTDKGQTSNRDNVLNKDHTFKYEIDNPNNYTNNYSVYDHDDEDDCDCYTTDEKLSDDNDGNKTPAEYPTTITFERYKPRDTVAPTVPYKENKENGKVTVVAQSPIILKVNPEVLMQYSDKSGRDNVTFTAGDKLRDVKPVSFHKIQYIAKVNPKVVGTAVATNPEAKALASRLNGGGSQVIYKGAGANISFDIDGKSPSENGYVETKSYILDIGNTAVKNSWNPSTSYTSQKVSEQFLGKITGKDANGKLGLNAKVVEQLSINSNLYGKNTENILLPQIEANTKEYKLVVRGGRLVSVDGDKNFKTNLPADVVNAFKEMTLLSDDGILKVFDRSQGKKPEKSFVTLGNAIRGTNDLNTESGWYNEDTTVLVVREYSNKFEIPVSMFADKVPMTVPELQAPVNKMDFFTKGKTGHTVYTNSVISNTTTLNPYDNTLGTVEAVTMKHDSSRLDSPFGNRTIDYVVPNVSILDTMQ